MRLGGTISSGDAMATHQLPMTGLPLTLVSFLLRPDVFTVRRGSEQRPARPDQPVDAAQAFVYGKLLECRRLRGNEGTMIRKQSARVCVGLCHVGQLSNECTV